MSSPQRDFAEIVELVTTYLDGLHEGDVDKLAAAFHPDARLQTDGLRLSRTEWLDKVAARPAPADQGKPYHYRILAIDVAGNEAVAKLRVPLAETIYVDFLSCLKERGAWTIVNKLYAEAG